MIGLSWTGWDGSQWDLRHGPVRITKGGLQGLGAMDTDVFTIETALVDGQRVTGWRGKERAVLLPLLIGPADTELAWLELDRSWWRTMHPSRYGTLRVTTPEGAFRELAARLKDDGGWAPETDPTLRCLDVAAPALVADDPWWYGPNFERTFSPAAAGVNFFGGATGKAAPFYIGSSNTLATAAITNPGDADVWPAHYLDGPITSWHVGIGGQVVAASFPIAANQQLVVETDPERQVATLVTGGQIENGVRVGGTSQNVTRQFDSFDFAPLPDGKETALDIAVNGTGRIRVSGRPRYFRAW